MRRALVPDEPIANSRDAVLMDVRPENVQYMGKAQLLQLQQRLGYGDCWGLFVASQEWMPPGHAQHLSTRSAAFEERLSSFGLRGEVLAEAVLALTRLATIFALIPVYSRRGFVFWKPNTLLRSMRYLIGVVGASALKNRERSDWFFDAYSVEDLAMSQSPKKIGPLLGRVCQLVERGLWSDRPRFDPLDMDEKSRLADDVRPKVESRQRPYLPLPDDFVAAAGWRLAWVSTNLGRALLEVAREFHQISIELPHVLPDISSRLRIKRLREIRRNEFLSGYVWRDASGAQINYLPFNLDVTGIGLARDRDFVWPPVAGTQVIALAKLLQVAHLFIFLMSVGSRISEALSLKPGCVVLSAAGVPLANGRTYKLCPVVGGEVRDWPVPKLALEALRQQEALVQVLGELGPLGGDAHEFDAEDAESLWVQVGSPGKAFKGDENVAIQNAIDALGLTESLGGIPITTHRFRKTIARLVALALIGAPKILMDLFGHKSIEMTLHYILSNPAIRMEMEEVAKAQTIMLAENAINQVDANGGPAAKRLAIAVQHERARLGSDFGANNVRELAETLTLSGRHWMYVRPGVICTKGAQEVGPCNKRVSVPEPSRCRWSCEHRLEEAVLKDDVDRALEDAVRHYTEERAADNEIMLEYWAGQILAHIRRFDSLHDRWRQNPLVAELLAKEGVVS